MAISHSAWGRVRRPKNILGPDGTTINGGSGKPLDDDATLTDDKLQSITSFAVSGQTLTMGIGDTTGYAVGDHVQLEGVRPRCLAERSFVVTAVAINTSVSVRLDLDAGQEIRKTADVLAQGAPKLRRRTTDGYPTENARFLHVRISGGTNGAGNVTINAYNYAFGAWSVLQLPLGRIAQEDADLEANTVDNVHVDAIFAITNGATRQFVIPINGIDRIGFTSDVNDKSQLTLSAAISTF